MNRVLDGFTTCLKFKLSDRAQRDKIAIAEGGFVLFETRSIDTVGGTTAFDTDSEIETNKHWRFEPIAGVWSGQIKTSSPSHRVDRTSLK